MNSHRLVLILFFVSYTAIFAQGSAGTAAAHECASLIDLPTAGILEKGNVGINVYLMPQGVTIAKIEVGVFKDFSFGISYGAANFIGINSPRWYKLPGVNIKARIIDETESVPAIAIGFDSQGKGEYDRDLNRFKVKSPGFYAAFSKNYKFLGFLSFHGTINYSLENEDRDKDPNISVGIEKTLGSKLSIITEYDFAINDNAKNSLGDGNGYLNAGLRWALGSGLTLGFDFRDLLSNKKLNAGAADRALKVEFIQSIF